MRATSWPSLCAVCRAWSAGRLCPDCVGRFVPAVSRCPRCALPGHHGPCGECLRNPPPYTHAVAAVDYAWPWDGLVADLKFHERLDAAGALAPLLAAAVERARLPPVALVVPVPLGPRRLRERGYNQAWEVARRVARTRAVAADPRLLARSGDTARQSELPRERRAANVRGTFVVEPQARARLRGTSVALVDDVMTTGATLREAARTLLDAGAAAVQAWVVARTPAPDEAWAPAAPGRPAPPREQVEKVESGPSCA